MYTISNLFGKEIELVKLLSSTTCSLLINLLIIIVGLMAIENSSSCLLIWIQKVRDSTGNRGIPHAVSLFQLFANPVKCGNFFQLINLLILNSPNCLAEMKLIRPVSVIKKTMLLLSGVGVRQCISTLIPIL